MRKIIINGLFMMLFLMQPGFIYSQQKIFNQINIPNFDASNSGGILGITQDHEEYIWFTTQNKGLYRYDGSQIVSYVHDAKDSASITSTPLFCNEGGAKGSAHSFALRKTTRSNLGMIKFSSIMCKNLLMLNEKSRVR